MNIRLFKTLFIESLAVLVFCTQVNYAADITVRSGEHATFSRIVLYFTNGTGWDFGRVEGGFKFRGSDKEAQYLFDSVFELIPRTRVKNIVDLGDGEVFFAVDCNCHGDAFDLPRGQVVIDFKDGPSTPDTEVFNRPLDSDGQEESVTGLITGIPQLPTLSSTPDLGEVNLFEARLGLPLVLPTKWPGSGGNEPVTPIIDTEKPVRAVDPISIEFPSVSETTPRVNSIPDIPTNPILDQRVIDTEAQLLEQIGRASTQGLLGPKLMEIVAPPTIDTPQTTTSPSTETTLSEDEIPKPDPLIHMSVVTAIDMTSESEPPSGGHTLEGNACPNDKLFSISEWGSTSIADSHLGTYRSGLLGEFDIAKTEPILALVKHYIFLTFGTEAIELIKFYEPQLGDTDILSFMAQIVDNQYSNEGAAWEKYFECSGKVVLWATLAQKNLEPGVEINGPAILAAFSELPLHLRRYFGPTLAARLIEAGKVEMAIGLRNSIERAPGDHGIGMSFLNAQLAIEQGQPQIAIETFESIIAGSSEKTPDAILALIEYKASQGILVSDGEISIAATLAFENRGSKLGRDLAQVEILGLASSGQFARAFSSFDLMEVQESTGREAQNKLLLTILENLVGKGNGAEFLRYSNRIPESVHLPKNLRYNFAHRLHDLGFQLAAREILGRSAMVPDTQERRLFAEIAIAGEHFDVALGYLAGLEDKVDLLLRAEAHAGKHELSQAAGLFAEAEDPTKVLKAAWRAGNWEMVASLDGGALGQVSTLMLSDSSEPAISDTQNGVPSQNSSLLSVSQRTREVIAQLLSVVEAPHS